MTDITTAALDPGDRLIYGADIDADLSITDRGRRKMVTDGRLPAPAGYIGGRAVWRRTDYLAARERLLAAGRPHQIGAPRSEVA
ncbi:MAG: hypothetical protein ACREU3_17330 [Steroidobacteraceae bacterium]